MNTEGQVFKRSESEDLSEVVDWDLSTYPPGLYVISMENGASAISNYLALEKPQKEYKLSGEGHLRKSVIYIFLMGTENDFLSSNKSKFTSDFVVIPEKLQDLYTFEL